MNNETKINKLKDLQSVRPLVIEEPKLTVEDFGIETEVGKETKIHINLTNGSRVTVGSIELREYDDFTEDFDIWMTNPSYYHAEMMEICQTYIIEAEDYKIEKED